MGKSIYILSSNVADTAPVFPDLDRANLRAELSQDLKKWVSDLHLAVKLHNSKRLEYY